MRLTATKLVEALKIDRKTVTNWLNEAEPVPGVKRGGMWSFELHEVVAWLEARAARQAVARVTRSTPADLEEAKTRKMAAEAELAEIELEKARGRVIEVAAAQATWLAQVMQWRAVWSNIPGRYTMAIMTATTAADAQAVGTAIRDDLLRECAESLVEDEPEQGGEAA